jgi:hypothetical protein
MARLEDENKEAGEEGYEDVVFKGVRVRMGMHHDVCEFTRDLVTDRVGTNILDLANIFILIIWLKHLTMK